MTPNDANQLLALAKANYSYAFKTMSNEEKIMLVQSWAFALQDIPADIVMLAFMQLLTTSKWLPTVAEIREKVRQMYYQASDRYDMMPEDAAVQRAREYIMRHTRQLRGDSDCGLSLESILAGPYMEQFGSGKMELIRIDRQEYLPESEG